MGHTARPLRIVQSHRIQKQGQLLLHCTFSNPETTFNFIKKLKKSNLAADQLLMYV